MPIGVNIVGLLAEASRPLTREIFGNVPRAAQALFYVVAAAAVGLSLYGIVLRVRLWSKGTRKGRSVLIRRLRFNALCAICCCNDVFGDAAWRAWPMCCCLAVSSCSRLARRSSASSTSLADLLGRGPGDPVFHKGIYFGVYEIVMDTFGVAFLAGCVMFLVRRVRGVGSFARSPADMAILLLLIAIGVKRLLD